MKYITVLIFYLFFIDIIYCQVQIVDLPKEGFEEKIISAVNEIKIIDTHEHLATEENRIQSVKEIDFTHLFSHYAKEDLISTSNNKALVEIIYNTDFPLSDRWELFEPYYKSMRSTGYGRVPLIIARDLYGVSAINRSTIEVLSNKIKESSKPGFYEFVLKDKAKIDLSIQDMGRQNYDKNCYRHVERFSQFALISSGSEIRNFGEQYNTQINNLLDYLKLLRIVFVEGVNSGMVGIKSGAAYLRILKFENVSNERGEEVLLNNTQVSTEDIKAVQDYLMHRILDLVDEFDLPIQFHTGLQAGNGNIITNSNPTHLANLFMEYPNIDFILFHGGYPYGGEIGTLAKSFPNVFLDMCWTYVISPTYSERYLNEWIETIPANKILGFGGGYSFVEAVYAHTVIACQTIANVLIEKVRTSYLTESEAIDITKMLLRENTLRIFKIDGGSNPADDLEIFRKPGSIRDWWEISKTNDGFVRSWKVIGVFNYGKGLENFYPPENEIKFDQSYIGKGGLVTWETENIDSSGYLNLISIMSKRNAEISPRA